MQTYYMGRFALDVPSEMKQAIQASRLSTPPLRTSYGQQALIMNKPN